MIEEKLKKNFILSTVLLSVLLLGTLTSFDFVSAQACPSMTTVSGTTVTFVGELTDMGGDTTTSVWFDYGQTITYGQKTTERVVTQAGIYCITVSGLSPCTTYHYRAVAQNSAGTSYGEDKIFTTTCSPTVDLKANNSDGPITIAYGSSATLSWNSTNANSCSASGGWSGSKSLSGSESTGNLTSSKIYTLTCTGSGGSSSDNVTVNVSPPFSPQTNLNLRKIVQNLSRPNGTDTDNNALVGETLRYTLIYTNNGNTTVNNVKIIDELPSYTSLVSLSSYGDYSSSANKISWNIGSLVADGNRSGSVSYEVKVSTVSVSGTIIFNSGLAKADGISDVYSNETKTLVSLPIVKGAAVKAVTGGNPIKNLIGSMMVSGLSIFVIWLILKYFGFFTKLRLNFCIYKIRLINYLTK